MRTLTLGEIRGWSLVQISAFPGTLPNLERAVRPFLGGDFPTHIGTCAMRSGPLLFKIGAEQFWVLSPDGQDLVPALQSTIPPEIGAVTSLSHSRARIFVQGGAARQVLSTGIVLDLHPDSFPVGAFALTGAHHAAVLLHRTRADRYELYVPRTFAAWIWDWLTDAALPIGYEVEPS